MEFSETRTLIHQIPNPAFLVRQGSIVDANAAARQQGITIGHAIAPMIANGKLEYQELTTGCLYLTLTIAKTACGASASRYHDFDLFLLEQEDDMAELQAMALAAQALRTPLANVMAVTDSLFPMVEMNGSREQAARINKGLYQMQRIIGNMSDAYRYSRDTSPKQTIRDIRALLGELFEKNIPLIAHAGITLKFTNLPDSVFCLVDEEKLERAVGNILSNALKFTPKGGGIDARLTHRHNMLYLTVQDEGPGIPDGVKGSIYTHFQRHPGVEDGRFGIGLGMVLIRAAAAAHGGTVLVDQPEGKGSRVTMTLAIRQKTDPSVRSTIFHVDYAGGRDHLLLELSEQLPADLYSKEL